MVERPERPERPDRDRDRGRPRGDGRPSGSGGTGRPRRDGDVPRGARPERAERPRRGDRPARPVGARQEGIRPRRTDDDDRPRHDDPVIPEEITGRELDKSARFELKTLSKENADRVAQHLVVAGTLIEKQPELAHLHAQAAARRAGRVAIVRETLAITAYATGDYALALRELRTYRRLSGSNEQLPLMVDCERGLGRPEKGLELGRSVDRSTLSVGTRVELAIAMSGARLDLGQTETALTELEIPQLDPTTAFSYSPDLFDAYAVVLAELGRAVEAEEWAQRADVAAEAISGAEGEYDDIVEITDEELAEPSEEAHEGDADVR